MLNTDQVITMLPIDRHNLFLDMLSSLPIIERLTALQGHDPLLDHSYHVGLLSLDLAIENGLNQDEIKTAAVAGLLHDIGKVEIPAKILDKPATLDENEMKVVQQHPRAGFYVLHELGEDMLKKIVVGHHEYQQDPYPRQSKPYNTLPREMNERRVFDPVIARLTEIVAISDIYDSLVSARAYKSAITDPLCLENTLRSQFTGSQTLVDQVLERYDLKY